MVNWKKVYWEPCKTSDVEPFAKPVSSWQPLIFFTKSSVLDIKKILNTPQLHEKKVASFLYIAIWINCIFYDFSTTKFQFEMLNVLGFLRPNVRPWIYNYCGNEYFENLITVSSHKTAKRFFWEIKFLKISRNFARWQQIWVTKLKSTC